jgi:hypothetical protein
MNAVSRLNGDNRYRRDCESGLACCQLVFPRLEIADGKTPIRAAHDSAILAFGDAVHNNDHLGQRAMIGAERHTPKLSGCGFSVSDAGQHHPCGVDQEGRQQQK